ncbi:MAG: quinoprotein dehydrogenase-associated putative ABC transporter substrate-binding protein [Hyphomicrobiales bacterium]|nr:MAG: quinoprotein dehydrogenase-associated putative ABC transporter substrate-binding protein [Hyphomicrobiales bacterium]
MRVSYTLLSGCAGVALVLAAVHAAGGEPAILRVCADPNNLPFSDADGKGLENRLAELVAREIGAKVSYTWWAQRRGFIRNTLKAGLCDVVMGVPAHFDPVETTRPYYRSSYVFVSREDRNIDVASLKDPRLHSLKIGVHLFGDDGMNSPPVHALGEQGIVGNVIGYMLYGDYRDATPPARLIEAVEKGDVELAAAWGPLAGYAALTSPVPLRIVPIADGKDFAPLQFSFDISMGVRKGDAGLKKRLDEIIAQKSPEIAALLTSYGIPLAPAGAR